MKTVSFILAGMFISGAINAKSLENRLDSLFKVPLEKGELHGCLAYIYKDGKVIVEKPYGYMDLENKKPMQKDAIFRIASMTKIFTAASAMKLYEEGKFLLDDPVKKYIPEFANLRVLAPGCTSVDKLVTVALERDVTIRDLLRHTAGFGYGGDDVVGKLYEKNISYSDDMTLKQFVQGIIKAPLKYQPGSKWEYSFSNDVLGYLIEVVSGKPLDVYMEEALFKPMGMTSTGFWVKKENLSRLCNYYEYSGHKLKLMDSSKSSKLAKRPAYISGGGGALSCIDDYSKFLEMVINYGTYKGKKIFNKETIELMVSDQIGTIKDRGFEVDGFGFGVGVTPGKNNGKVIGGHWAGSPYNDSYSFYFDRQVIAILFMQNGPWEHLGLMDKFQHIVWEETK